ncbi:MAG: DUF6691 family protein [Parvularcula sp.]|jgi:uncharacterized membrane protein YedE/YeeE|nr:DUF6691 family protein [Parvularcula sp.]
MKEKLSAFLIGCLFGGGLIVSGMTNPLKVQNFLDLFGLWDPSLALVMGGALVVTFAGFALIRRRKEPPAFAETFAFPTATQIDRRLVLGSLLFGMGWGLAGLCPGPGIAVMGIAPQEGVFFLGGLLGGMMAFAGVSRLGKPRTTGAAATSP